MKIDAVKKYGHIKPQDLEIGHVYWGEKDPIMRVRNAGDPDGGLNAAGSVLVVNLRTGIVFRTVAEFRYTRAAVKLVNDDE